MYIPLHVLAVEENEEDARFIEQVGSESPLVETLRVLKTAEEAQDYLAGEEPCRDRSTYPLPSLILLDLRLPRMSGLALLRWIRRSPILRHTSVVVLCGSDSASDLNRAFEIGIDGYLEKPDHLGELSSMLAGVLVTRAESGSPLARIP